MYYIELTSRGRIEQVDPIDTLLKLQNISERFIGPFNFFLFSFCCILTAQFAIIPATRAQECHNVFEELSKPFRMVVDRSSGRKFKVTGSPKNSELTGPRYFQKTLQSEIRIIGIPTDAKEPTELGFIRVTYGTATRDLEISNIDTVERFQKQGLGGAATELALRQFPDTASVSAKLTKTNADEFVSALRAARAASSRGELDKTRIIETAFKNTPTYKHLAALGFSEIDMKYSYYDPTEPNSVDQIFLRVKRPSP
jgi:hypothetical protein